MVIDDDGDDSAIQKSHHLEIVGGDIMTLPPTTSRRPILVHMDGGLEKRAYLFCSSCLGMFNTKTWW